MSKVLFYIAGETIPLSDSDQELDSDTESLDGLQRQADMSLLTAAVSQYGLSQEAVRIVAGMLKAKRSKHAFFVLITALLLFNNDAMLSLRQMVNHMTARTRQMRLLSASFSTSRGFVTCWQGVIDA